MDQKNQRPDLANKESLLLHLQSNSDNSQESSTENEFINHNKYHQELKRSIRENQNSGRKAWRIGDLLLSFRNTALYKLIGKNQRTFEEYVNEELKISIETCEKYILIRESFLNPSEIPEYTAITHLEYILTTHKNNTHLILKALEKIHDKVSKKIIIESLNIINSENKNIHMNEDMYINRLAEIITHTKIRTKEELSKNRSYNRLPASYGKPIGNKIIGEFYPYEPINEQGVVALFCMIFHKISEIDFKLKKDRIKIKKIIAIQEKYPDAILEVFNQKNHSMSINIEFEFKSANYLKHEHHKEKIETHLIICWENNFKNISFGTHPPILSLKEFISSNQLIAHHNTT